MQEIKTKVIDEISYDFSFLAPSKAQPLSILIVKSVLAPAGAFISGFLGSINGELGGTDLSKLNITEACEKLAANLKPEELAGITADLLKTVTFTPGPIAQEKGGIEIKLDRDFRGKPKHLWKVLAAAMEVNFGDFFDDLGDLAEKLKKTLSILVPTRSAGKSGE